MFEINKLLDTTTPPIDPPDPPRKHEPEKPEKPPEPKSLTIKLTNRCPIKIVEDQWPVIANGGEGDEESTWGVYLRVLQNGNRLIVYGVYSFDYRGDYGDTIRHHAGRFLDWGDIKTRDGVILNHDFKELREAIVAVADDLRQRIAYSDHKRGVMFATDACFASLPAREVR
jgi:hypothetical protein